MKHIDLFVLSLIGVQLVCGRRRPAKLHGWDCSKNQICADNGVTYDNMCDFQQAKLNDKYLQVITEGPCAHFQLLKVDGSGNKIRKSKTQDLFLMTLIGVHPISTRRGPKYGCIDEQMCATDGVTYNSSCQFERAKLHEPDLQVIFEGPCTEFKYIQLVKYSNNYGSQERSRPQRQKLFNSKETRVYSQSPSHQLLHAPRQRDVYRLYEFDVLFQEGPLHGLLKGTNGAKNFNYASKERSISDLMRIPTRGRHELGWSSISKK